MYRTWRSFWKCSEEEFVRAPLGVWIFTQSEQTGGGEMTYPHFLIQDFVTVKRWHQCTDLIRVMSITCHTIKYD